MFTSRRITTMSGDKFRDEFSLAFDGSDDYIDLGSQAGDLRLSGSNGAVVAWIKPTLTGDSYQRIVDKSGGANANQGYALFLHTDGHMIGAVNGANKVTGTAGDVVANKWQQVLWTWDGTNHYLYVNGVNVRTQADSTVPPSNTTNMRIGSWNHSTAREYNGKISEVAIYNTGLTASQVKTLYNGREPYNHKEGIASGNLLGWWRMGDGTLDKATLDMAGSGDTGLICDEVNPTLGAELVSNGDFDDETNYSDYLMEGDDTADLSTEQVLVGSNSLKIDVDSSGEGTRLGGVATTTGKTYRISAWFYVTAGTAKINPGDGYWSPNGLEPKTKVTNKWQQLVMYNTADQDSSNAWIYFVAGSNNSVFYLDNVSVREVQGNPGIFLNSDNQFSGDTP